MVYGPRITTVSLPIGETGYPYSQSLSGTSGQPPYTWTLGVLPNGLSASPSGVISGTPSTVQSLTFPAQFTDANGQLSPQVMLTLQIIQGLSITTASPLPNATQNVAYSTPLAAAGGLAPYVWSLPSQTGSNGWSITSQGVVTGTPSGAETDILSAQVVDALGIPSAKNFNLTVSAPTTLAITSSTPQPTATQGASYSSALAATGGSPAYTWAAPYVGSGLTLSPAGVVSGTPTIPTLAQAAGYTLQTFGSLAQLNSNWFNHNFYKPVTADQAAQQTDGTLLISGVGNGYGVCTAFKNGATWSGTAFGGGAYIRFVFSYVPTATPVTNWPALWANDIETMSTNSVTAANQWQGQASNYGNWIETDFFEADAASTTKWGTAIHNWYGIVGQGTNVSTAFPAFTIANPQTVNVLEVVWIVATATTQGSLTLYLNNTQIAQTKWNQYSAATPPPPVVGSSAYSVLDSRHLALIMNSAVSLVSPMTIYSVDIYQATTANNITQ